MKNRTGDDWFPMWVDKWLFGSTRHELLPDEQSVWIDFLSLGAKDDGHIRANETTPYPISQLAGLLCKTEELIQRSIDKCIATGKIIITDSKTLYICHFNDYELSNRHKRRLEGDKSRLDKNRLEESRVEGVHNSDIMSVNTDIPNPVGDKDSIKGEVEEETNFAGYTPTQIKQMRDIFWTKPVRKPKYTAQDLIRKAELERDSKIISPEDQKRIDRKKEVLEQARALCK